MMDPSKMTVARLKEELDALGLSTTGKKEELYERLIEALDRSDDDDEEEEEEEEENDENDPEPSPAPVKKTSRRAAPKAKKADAVKVEEAPARSSRRALRANR
mmetsp:Transcript_12980/g.52279  ORF Transcript_12980/g.52279 Transcript_12980/m.52279 type:complete len:103 (-) Transcript_12980:1078-1386(-)